MDVRVTQAGPGGPITAELVWNVEVQVDTGPDAGTRRQATVARTKDDPDGLGFKEV